MAIHSVKHGMTNAEIEDLFFVLAQFINQSGVIATGDLLVEAQATPDMTVKVAIGRAVLKTTDGRNGYPVYNDASANVTIAANSSGVAKIDAVVLYWDGAASSDANATNVAKLTTVRGTGSATPTDGEIQTAVGAGNPFLRLADVAVANGASSINSGNITDKRVYADPWLRRLVLANNQALRSKNAAGTAEVEVARLGTDDLLRIGQIYEQANTTNTKRGSQLIQRGWGFIQSNGGVSTKAITFPIAYDDGNVDVSLQYLGSKNNSDPTSRTDGPSSFDTAPFVAPASVTATGFSAGYMATAATWRHLFTWIAIGTKA